MYFPTLNILTGQHEILNKDSCTFPRFTMYSFIAIVSQFEDRKSLKLLIQKAITHVGDIYFTITFDFSTCKVIESHLQLTVPFTAGMVPVYLAVATNICVFVLKMRLKASRPVPANRKALKSHAPPHLHYRSGGFILPQILFSPRHILFISHKTMTLVHSREYH